MEQDGAIGATTPETSTWASALKAKQPSASMGALGRCARVRPRLAQAF
jgi:hypothetical protein